MEQLATFLAADTDVVRIELVRTKGSTPRESGARMFVSPHAITGTIGGGHMEYMAIDEAREMLRTRRLTGHMEMPLGPEIGQCCGGFVELSLSVLDQETRQAALREDQAMRDAWPTVVIFGSGHVGRALADILAHMPVRTVLVDDRKEELALCQALVLKRCTPIPEQEIRLSPPCSAYVIATNDHAEDFLIAAEALARPDAAYTGLIGSKTKRVSFERWLAKHGTKGLNTDALVCPIGNFGNHDKRPEVIAVFVAAEIMARLTDTGAGAVPSGAHDLQTVS